MENSQAAMGWPSAPTFGVNSSIWAGVSDCLLNADVGVLSARPVDAGGAILRGVPFEWRCKTERMRWIQNATLREVHSSQHSCKACGRRPGRQLPLADGCRLGEDSAKVRATEQEQR
jgi:hypothetical protein